MSDPNQHLELRMDYLHRHYALFTTLTNAMFGFFLVAATLTGAGYGQLLTSDPTINKAGAVVLAVFGGALSWLFYMIDKRSRVLMKSIEKDLMEVEPQLYGSKLGFITRKEQQKSGNALTFRKLFKGVYYVFMGAFSLLLLVSILALVMPRDARESGAPSAQMIRPAEVPAERPPGGARPDQPALAKGDGEGAG